MFLNNHMVKVFATTGSTYLAEAVCKQLQQRLPSRLQPNDTLELGKVTIEKFSNENIQAQIENVRGYFVVIIHTQVPPVNEGLIELFALLDAVYNAGPEDVLLVFPYMPYSRSDSKNKPRISTMGQRLADILVKSYGLKRVLLLDPHDTHIKHYFEPTADEITVAYLFADYIERKIFTSRSKENTIIVFSDAGATKKFEKFPHIVGLPQAYIDKKRPDDKEKPEFKKVVGEVKGKTCFLIDDEILTGGTAVGDAENLLKEGADSVSMLAVHPIFANKKDKTETETVQRLEKSPLEQIVITDSIPIRHKLTSPNSKIVVLSVAPLLAEAISRIILNKSITVLHQRESVKFYRPEEY